MTLVQAPATADVIVDAMRSRYLVEFNYMGHPRVVEPVVLGVHALTGNPVLSARQIGGTAHEAEPPAWGLFLLFKMRGVRSAPVPDGWVPPGRFATHEESMSTVLARLS